MLKNIRYASAIMFAMILVVGSACGQLVQLAEVNFDDIPPGGIPFGLVFNSGGVDIGVSNGGFGAVGPGVEITNPAAPFVMASFPHVATPNNVGLKFAMPTIPGTTNVINFDYFNQGGDVTMELNGALVGPIPNYPGVFAMGGAMVTNSFAFVGTDIIGSVRIESTSTIDSFMVGGQETQFDNFLFHAYGILGDVNCDGEVNLLDVDPFVNLLTNGGFNPKADMNQDGQIDLLDVEGFIDAL